LHFVCPAAVSHLFNDRGEVRLVLGAGRIDVQRIIAAVASINIDRMLVVGGEPRHRVAGRLDNVDALALNQFGTLGDVRLHQRFDLGVVHVERFVGKLEHGLRKMRVEFAHKVNLVGHVHKVAAEDFAKLGYSDALACARNATKAHGDTLRIVRMLHVVRHQVEQVLVWLDVIFGNVAHIVVQVVQVQRTVARFGFD